jgi:hypothetical protein
LTHFSVNDCSSISIAKTFVLAELSEFLVDDVEDRNSMAEGKSRVGTPAMAENHRAH